MSQKNKKNIIIISTWFPPLQSVAVNRILSFVKYLDSNKYNIFVITKHKDNAKEVEKMFGATIYRIKTEQLIKVPNFDTKTSKITHYLKVAKKLLITKLIKDEDTKWQKKALQKIESINSTNKIDLIISSYAPISPILVALEYCKNHPSTKWIVDMRDELSQNPMLDNSKKEYYAKIESEINLHANALTTVSLPIINYFKAILPRLQYFEEIRNGYDHNLPIDTNYFNPQFTISYAGTFYGTRKPNFFFKALSELKIEHKIPNDIIIKFIGCPNNFKVPNEFSDNTKFYDKVEQEQSIKMLSQSDVNLLIQPNWGRKGNYTGKIFDYISVQRTVLALVDSTDVAADLIDETNAGFVAEFNNIKEIKTAIEESFKLWKNKQSLSFKNVSLLHRKHQVKKLESLIDILVNE